jgi:C4-type Zn-finger protein
MSKKDDIIKEEFKCPRCGETLKEKFPKDKFIVRRKLLTLRLFCSCGYYRDEIWENKNSQK